MNKHDFLRKNVTFFYILDIYAYKSLEFSRFNFLEILSFLFRQASMVMLKMDAISFVERFM